MIIARIHAGLGNQMFEYACARALSLRFGCPLQLDISDCGSKTPYGLGVFNVTGQFATAETVKLMRKRRNQLVRIVYLFTKIDIRRYSRYYFLESAHRPDPASLVTDPVNKDYYIEGYWQSQNYFADAQNAIRRDFTLREPLSGQNAEIEAAMRTGNSVSLHIRRGDYFSVPKHRKTFGVPLDEYARRAMRFIAERVENPHFYVFSDELDWVREHVRFEHPATFVDHNNRATAYCDLVLMSRCKHHIIANSTFSWWGAWLGDHPGKIVTAPQPWFLNPARIPPGIIPADWHEIPALDERSPEQGGS